MWKIIYYIKEYVLFYQLKAFTVYGLLLLIVTQLSCKKLVEIDAPVSSVNQANVYRSDATAVRVLTGIYTAMSSGSSYCTGINGISLIAGLSADEWHLDDGNTDARLNAYYRNMLSVNNSTGSDFWVSMYRHIFLCNAAIEGLNSSSTLTPSVKQQLLGEAKFLRAFAYFYLVNLFGDVPLPLTTDYKLNVTIARSPMANVYQQIVADLQEAFTMLKDSYLDGNLQNYKSTPERVRPTKWAAAALLSRVYLYISDFTNAEAFATEVISNSALFKLVPLGEVFIKNSLETIWQLQPITMGMNTSDALTFIIPSTGYDGAHPVAINNMLLSSFEPDDKRKTTWINGITVNGTIYNYAYKYKRAKYGEPLTEYLMVFRLGEQYLIRAEARVKRGDVSGAVSDLNAIRERAGLAVYAGSMDETTLLNTIMQERRAELFTEWGHRWFDLKRTNTVDRIMDTATAQKGGTWKRHQQLYPLAASEIEKNANLVQNVGY